MREAPTRSAALLRIFILALLYVASGWLGLELATLQENATLIWPPSGLSLGALLVFGWRIWPGVLIGALMLNALSGTEPGVATAISLGNTLEALVGCQLLVRGFDFRPNLARVRDVLVLVLVGGLVASGISAGVGVLSLWLSSSIQTEQVPTVFLIWWRGNLGGVVAVAPLVLVIRSGRPEWTALVRHRVFWTAAGLVLVSCSIAFGGFADTAAQNLAALVPFACLVWAGVRLGTRGAVLISLATLVISTVATTQGLGPFVGADLHLSLTLLWAYGLGLATTALTLAAAVAQRDLAESRREHETSERQEIEREQSISRERERIMREMHDGIGGQLVSVLSMVQRGQASPNEIAEALRRSLDDMRIVIDSMDSERIGFRELLGRLRARLEPLLRRNGLTLLWRVADDPVLDTIEPEPALHILRIVQESVANVVQHASASEVAVRIDAADGIVEIEIRDNGTGSDSEASSEANGEASSAGRGTRNMLARARALGAEFDIEQSDRGRRVWLRLALATASR